jgi:hypothetical protein
MVKSQEEKTHRKPSWKEKTFSRWVTKFYFSLFIASGRFELSHARKLYGV